MSVGSGGDYGGCQLMGSRAVGRETLRSWRRRVWKQIRRKAALRTRMRQLVHLAGAKAAADHVPVPAVTKGSRAWAIRDIQAGDWVRVRSRDEIARTLDSTQRLRGCPFIEAMSDWCGKQVRVARRVEHFFDEAQWRMRKTTNIVLLEGVFCDGSGHPDTRGCDRSCYFFWRTEWLEPVSRGGDIEAAIVNDDAQARGQGSG